MGGSRRFLCLNCKKSFTWKQSKLLVAFSDFQDFYNFVSNRQNRSRLIEVRHQSRKTISKRFQIFFKKPLTSGQVWKVIPPPFSSAWVYSVDGKWLRRQGVILIHRNVTNKEILWWSWVSSESYAAILGDLISLTPFFPNKPAGVVSDWKGSIRNGVSQVFGITPHQRCLAHVNRDIKRSLAKRSPLEATQELRRIGLAITNIKTKQEKKDWQLWLSAWEMAYGDFLREKTYYHDPETRKQRWWYTHKQLRSGYRILTHDQESLFTHLSHPLIPTTNNGLEAINGDIKTKLANHRGMQYPQQYSFVSWYLTFSKVKTGDDLKKLWDLWVSVK